MLRELKQDPTVHPNELVTFAEFLATAKHPELADCAEAWRLVDAYELEREFADHAAGGAQSLAAIRAACPR
jgi:hypothetical protein